MCNGGAHVGDNVGDNVCSNMTLSGRFEVYETLVSNPANVNVCPAVTFIKNGGANLELRDVSCSSTMYSRGNETVHAHRSVPLLTSVKYAGVPLYVDVCVSCAHDTFCA